MFLESTVSGIYHPFSTDLHDLNVVFLFTLVSNAGGFSLQISILDGVISVGISRYSLGFFFL